MGIKQLRRSTDLVEPYIKECRLRTSKKCSDFFNYEVLLKIQRQHILKDFVRNIFNAFYAPIYIVAKSFVFWLDEMGIPKVQKKFKKLPPNWSTEFQKEVELFLSDEVFLVSEQDLKIKKNLNFVLKEFGVRRAKKTSMNSSFVTMIIGYLFFKGHNFSLVEVSRAWAKNFANSSAASDFFLGEGIGNVFYSVFPTDPDFFQLSIVGTIVLLGFGFLIHVYSTLLFAIQIKYGLYHNRVKNLVDRVHDELVLSENGKSSLGRFEF